MEVISKEYYIIQIKIISYFPVEFTKNTQNKASFNLAMSIVHKTPHTAILK